MFFWLRVRGLFSVCENARVRVVVSVFEREFVSVRVSGCAQACLRAFLPARASARAYKRQAVRVRN